MSKKNRSVYDYCNNLANQINFLATIYSAIISEEVGDDENNLESDSNINVEDVFDRSSNEFLKNSKHRRIRKKIKKRKTNKKYLWYKIIISIFY